MSEIKDKCEWCDEHNNYHQCWECGEEITKEVCEETWGTCYECCQKLKHE